jgi:hypothetical protein
MKQVVLVLAILWSLTDRADAQNLRAEGKWGFDPVSILSFGAIGFGFLLAFMAYRLLVREQNRPKAQPATIKMLYGYMAFCIALTAFGFVFEFARHRLSAADSASLRAEYEAQLNSLRAELDAQPKKLRAEYDAQLKQRFLPVLTQLDKAVLPSVQACKKEAEGAAGQGNDIIGCLHAGRRGIEAARNADVQIGVLRSQILHTIGAPENSKP